MRGLFLLTVVQAGGFFDSISNWGQPQIPDQLNPYKPKIDKLENDLNRWCMYGTGYDPREHLKKYRQLFSQNNVGIDPKTVPTDCSKIQQIVLPENHAFSAYGRPGPSSRYSEPTPDRHTGFTPPHIDFPDDFEPEEDTSEDSETDDDSPKRTKARGTSGNTIMGISALVVLLICVTIIACICYKAGNCVMCNNINCFGANQLKVAKDSEALTPLPSRQASYVQAPPQAAPRSLSNVYSPPPSYHQSAPSLAHANTPLLNSRDSMEKAPIAGGSNWGVPEKSESGW